MNKNNELMSLKEKDYIAFCFNKSFNSLKTDIDYGLVLDNKKIDYDSKQAKKEIKTIFGKSYRKSRKHLRESANSKTSFLENDLLITQFFEIFTVLKYVELDLESKLEIEQNLISYFTEYLQILCNNEKMFNFLGKSLNLLSDSKKTEMIKLIFINSKSLTNTEILFKFLDANVNALPIDESFINDGLWSSNSGYLLGLFILLKNQDFLNKIVESFLKSNLSDCVYLHKFLDVLISLSDESVVEKIKKKVKNSKIEYIQTRLEDLSLDK